MHNYEDHGKTSGNASDGINLEEEPCTLGCSGSRPPSDPFLILSCSALYPPGLTPDSPGPTSGASGGVWTAAGTQETGGWEEGRGQGISPLFPYLGGGHFERQPCLL